VASNGNKDMKREVSQKFKEINDLLLSWFNGARSRGIPISGPLLQEKARHFAELLKIENFKASNGWLNKFCHRNNIVFRAICGESASVNENDVSDWTSKIADIIGNYEPRNIYNADETGLFFRAIPNKSLVVKNSSCIGVKHAKERITLLFCVNAAGEKERPLIINKSLRPRCFANKNMGTIGVDWYANKNAWMTLTIFQDWLDKFNEKMRKENRKVLLIIDNATCHKPNCEKSNVKLLFLPANTSSKLQPLDQGIIQSFKLLYRRRILSSLVARMDEGINVEHLIKKITVADAVTWTKFAWDLVGENTVKMCFNICLNKSEGTRKSVVYDLAAEIREVEKLSGQANVQLLNDDDIQTCAGSDENWEENLNKTVSEENDNSLDLESDNNQEEVTDKLSSIPLSESLNILARFRILADELGDAVIQDLLEKVEARIENAILLKKNSKKQRTLDHYFSHN